MWLPTQAQVSAFTRHLASVAAGAGLVLGLGSKVDTAALTQAIAAAGTVVNDVVILITVATPIVAGLYASRTASPTAQAAALGSSSSTIVEPAPGGTARITVTDPAMAQAALNAQRQG
jgi:hypothetical protein